MGTLFFKRRRTKFLYKLILAIPLCGKNELTFATALYIMFNY